MPVPDFHGYEAWLLVFAGLALLALLTSRVRIIRWLISIACWAAIAWVLVQYEPFNPLLGRIGRFLNLDDQQVIGREVRIRMAPDGHFWAHVRLNGIERRMLIDSGATITALSSDTAAQAGLKPHRPTFPLLLRTANGAVPAETATLGDLRLGDIRARDLPVVVSPAFAGLDVLGMNFLSQLKSWRVEGDTLILVPHHPQDNSSAKG